jgi:hypothetical protein
VAEEISSLSAILLDEDYYRLVHEGSVQQDGLSVLPAEYLIPMKARAYLDLRARMSEGEAVSSDDVKKHRNDIIRMSQLISPADRVALPDSVRDDLAAFVVEGLPDGCDPDALRVQDTSLDDIRDLMSDVYELSHDSSSEA